MKVFISSVIQGFETYRSAADEAIRTLSHEPVRAENFPASPNTPQQACLEGVRESDALLLILGQRYGAPQANGISATHEEYNEAKRQSISVLVFCQRGITRENTQEQFIDEVESWTSGRFSASFTTESELEKKIITALHRLEQRAHTSPTDEEDILQRALERMQEIDDAVLSQTLLAVATACSPTQSILRPSELECQDFAQGIMNEATLGEFPLFRADTAVSSQIRNDALLLSTSQEHIAYSFQPVPYSIPTSSSRRSGRYQQASQFSMDAPRETSNQSVDDPSLSLLIDDQGSVRVTRAAVHQSRLHLGEIQSFIEEHIREGILNSIRLSEKLLQRIDSNWRLSSVAIVVGLLGPIHHPWRTRRQQEASPHSATIGYGMNNEPIIVHLNPAVRSRSDLLGESALEVAEDLTVLLRRKVRDSQRL